MRGAKTGGRLFTRDVLTVGVHTNIRHSSAVPPPAPVCPVHCADDGRAGSRRVDRGSETDPPVSTHTECGYGGPGKELPAGAVRRDSHPADCRKSNPHFVDLHVICPNLCLQTAVPTFLSIGFVKRSIFPCGKTGQFAKTAQGSEL